MSAQIICAPSWGYTFVRNYAEPEKLGKELLELVRRDGAEAVSDALNEEKDWDFISADAGQGSGEIVSDTAGASIKLGYGTFLAHDAVPDMSDISWSYGILTDGTIMVTDCISRQTVALDPFADGAEQLLARFCSETYGE